MKAFIAIREISAGTSSSSFCFAVISRSLAAASSLRVLARVFDLQQFILS
jgi:hypothetical protein